ncbi:MAG: carbon-nitrogen hydrolase family protein [Chloroflexota bacterium]
MTTPPTTPSIRAAAVQLAVTNDVAANLATCCRLIDEAAQLRPHIVVLPEFCNHLAWYDDRDHCYAVAVDLDGEFLAAIGAKAAEHGLYLSLNCTVRRPGKKVTGTNLLLGPDGRLLAQADKQVLMGNENNFLEPAQQSCEIIQLPWGRVGLYCCMDGVIFETARGLAVRGAQLLLNSLNSFAKDEGSLHIPVRAAENKVFVAAANKVGALVPPEMLTAVADRLQIAPEQLHGAGHSQIVAPDGTVLAQAPSSGEAIIWADIDLAQADNKTRPDGTDIMQTRRPSLYQIFRQPPRPRQRPPGAAEVVAAVYRWPTEGWTEDRGPRTEDLLPSSVIRPPSVIVLPELAFVPEGRVDDTAVAVQQSAKGVAQIQALLQGSETIIATTIVELTEDGGRRTEDTSVFRPPSSVQHSAVLISSEGIILRQPQLHASGRHPWVTVLGESVVTLDLPWGRIGLVAGSDAIYPETFRLLALQDVEVVAVSTQILEAWETSLGLPERAAENRLNLVVGSRREGLILAADPDFTLWTAWQKRPFDGNINYPIVTHSTKPGLTCAPIYPAATANRTISQQTNVVDSRPWWLADSLL